MRSIFPQLYCIERGNMSAWKLLFTFLLMASIVAVHKTLAGRIPNEVCKHFFLFFLQGTKPILTFFGN